MPGLAPGIVVLEAAAVDGEAMSSRTSGEAALIRDDIVELRCSPMDPGASPG